MHALTPAAPAEAGFLVSRPTVGQVESASPKGRPKATALNRVRAIVTHVAQTMALYSISGFSLNQHDPRGPYMYHSFTLMHGNRMKKEICENYSAYSASRDLYGSHFAHSCGT